MTWYQDGFDTGFVAGLKSRNRKAFRDTAIDVLNEEIRALSDSRFGHLSPSSTDAEVIQAALDLIRGKDR